MMKESFSFQQPEKDKKATLIIDALQKKDLEHLSVKELKELEIQLDEERRLRIEPLQRLSSEYKVKFESNKAGDIKEELEELQASFDKIMHGIKSGKTPHKEEWELSGMVSQMEDLLDKVKEEEVLEQEIFDVWRKIEELINTLYDRYMTFSGEKKKKLNETGSRTNAKTNYVFGICYLRSLVFCLISIEKIAVPWYSVGNYY